MSAIQSRIIAQCDSVSARNYHPLPIVIEQAGRVTLTSPAFHNNRMGPFLERLCHVAEMDMALPMSTGAEAVETAIKLVRKWGYTVKGVPDGRSATSTKRTRCRTC